MSVMTLEGVVENGAIPLINRVALPEKTRVYIVVPQMESNQLAYIYSPRLVHREQAAYFALEVIEESADDNIQ